MAKTYNIIRPIGLKPLPDKYEERVAELCAEYFESDIAFVMRDNHTTPDIFVTKTRQFWEIKNIRSSGKHAVEDNLRKASKQSKNVIISILRAKDADVARTEARLRHIIKTKRMLVSRVLFITKSQKIIDVY